MLCLSLDMKSVDITYEETGRFSTIYRIINKIFTVRRHSRRIFGDFLTKSSGRLLCVKSVSAAPTLRQPFY
ncbi:hypothetical protein OKW41_005639 [Paraburkholderia sp. UCT70]